MPREVTSVGGQEVTLWLLPTAEEVTEHWPRFRWSDDIFGLDVESTAITDAGVFDADARLRLVQLGTATEAWVLDPINRLLHRDCLVHLLAATRKRLVTHTNYDVLWVRREFKIDLAERAIDTHTMSSLLEPGELNDHDLKGLTERYIDGGLRDAETALHARFKELAKADDSTKGNRVGKKLKAWGYTNVPLDDAAYLLYAALDAVYVRRLLDHLAAEFTELPPEFAALSKQEQQVRRLATDMQWRGMLVDQDWTRGLLKDIEGEYHAADERLAEIFGFSPRSPKRRDWLTEQGVKFDPKGKRTKTGLPSLEHDALAELEARYRGSHVGPVLADMVTLSEKQNLLYNVRKILSTMDSEGYVHPDIKTLAARTGRMSARNPAMQTFKKTDPRLRGCFVARPGYTLIGADYDSIEIRIGAGVSRDPRMLNVVLSGLNQHDETAKALFGPDYTQEQRDKIAKPLNFGQQYGLGPKKLSIQLAIPYKKAYQLWSQWREAYAGLVGWSESMQDFEVVINPWGRRLPRDEFRPYANGNYYIQSSGRDILGDAMVRLAERGFDRYLWLPVHDELVLEVPEHLADELMVALQQCMETEFMGIPITAEPEIIGHRWGAKHD